MLFRSLFAGTRTRRRYIASQEASDNILLYLSSGSFTRTSSGSYYNGTTSSLAWANPNVLRWEDRGDGFGPLALIEGSRISVARNSGPYSPGTAWSGASILNGSAAIAWEAEEGPFGANTATRLPFSALDYSRVVHGQTNDVTNFGSVNYSLFARVMPGSGSANVRLAIRARDGVTYYSNDMTITEEYRRLEWSTNVLSGANAVQLGIANGTDAIMRTIHIAASHTERNDTSGSVVPFPSSYINVPSSSPITRGADNLIFSASLFTSAMTEIATNGFEFDYYPSFSSEEFLAGGTSLRITGHAGATHTFLVSLSGGRTFFAAYENGAIRINTGTGPTYTWSRNQRIRIGIYPNAGRVILSGLTAGDGTYTGTAFTWPSGSNFSVGSHNGTFHTFGRFSNIYRSGSLGL